MYTKRKRRRRTRAGGPLGITLLSIGGTIVLGALATFLSPHIPETTRKVRLSTESQYTNLGVIN